MEVTSSVLNLRSLAKSNPGKPLHVHGNLSVQVLREPETLTLETPLWLLVLEGGLIVDLPYGDFRILDAGDSLTLQPGVRFTLSPRDEVVILRE